MPDPIISRLPTSLGIEIDSRTRNKAWKFDIPSMQIPPTLVDGVFQGGGALGVAYAGALNCLQSHNIWFKSVAGTSAGAITAAMVAAGFTAQEIQWLSSAYTINPPPKPNSLATYAIDKPIPFDKFLDLPGVSQIGKEAKHKTALWKGLKLQVIDSIGALELKIPTQAGTVNKCVNAILDIPLLGYAIRAIPQNVGVNLLQDALNIGLALLPDSKPHVRDFMLIDTEPLRDKLADTLWDAIATLLPIELLITNLLYEGGIFEGDAFLRIFGELLNRRINIDKDVDVQFEDLNIPLAVIATDLVKGGLVVYSSHTHPKMRVVDAVRQSMSIPFVFQPLNNGRFVDGGLSSNFPIWLFSEAGKKYWDNNIFDIRRPKIGISLEDRRMPKGTKQSNGRFDLVGDPPHVDDMKVLTQVLAKILKGVEIPEKNLRAANFTPQLDDIAFFKELMRFTSIDKEEVMRTTITQAITSGMTYYDIAIPLLGFHWLDFDVNKSEAHLFSMWDRAWNATSGAVEGLKPPPYSKVRTSPYSAA